MADLHTKIITHMKWGLPTIAILISISLFWAAEPVPRLTSKVDLNQLVTDAEIGIGKPEHYARADNEAVVFMTADRAILDNDSAPNMTARSYFVSIKSSTGATPVEVTAEVAYMVGRENRAALSGAVVLHLPDGLKIRLDELDIFLEDRVAEGRGHIHAQNEILEVHSDYLHLTWTPDGEIKTLQYTGRVRSIYLPKESLKNFAP